MTVHDRNNDFTGPDSPEPANQAANEPGEPAEPAAIEPAASAEPGVTLAPSRRMGRAAKAVVAGALLVSGAAGAAVLGPLAASAASPSATPRTDSAAAWRSPLATTSRPCDARRSRRRRRAQGPGRRRRPDDRPGGSGRGHSEAVSDTSVVAKAIGITEAQLLTELNAGKTPAQVATAHGVAVQKVIDALVADGLSELQADVKAGRLTQAQADAMKSQVTQRATDQVNNGLRGGPH